MRVSIRRPGFTLFQLLIVLALLAILLALLLPAVAKVREAAARSQSQNNLKQLMLSVHNYFSTFNKLPPGVDDNHFSATAKLLPFVEQDNVYKNIDFKKSIDDKANADTRKIVIRTFLSPNDPVPSVKEDWGATNYLFSEQVLEPKAKFTLANIPDGTSNTIFLGETLKGDGGKKAVTVLRQHVELGKDALKGIKPDAGAQDFKDNKHIAGDRCASWMDGRFLKGTFNGALKPNDDNPDVTCAGLGGVSALRTLDKMVNVGMGDGSVRAVSIKISLETWRNAMDPADGNPLGADW